MTTTTDPQGRADTVAALPRFTIADIRDLPTIPLWHATEPSAAAVLRLSRSLAYDAAARGELPHLRIGSRLVCPVPALLRMLGEVPTSPASVATVTPAVTSAAAAGASTPETGLAALADSTRPTDE